MSVEDAEPDKRQWMDADTGFPYRVGSARTRYGGLFVRARRITEFERQRVSKFSPTSTRSRNHLKKGEQRGLATRPDNMSHPGHRLVRYNP